MTINTGSWLIAMAVDSLAYYFPEAAREGMGNWIEGLHATSVGLTAHQGGHRGLHVSMAALSGAISAANDHRVEGSAPILRKLVELHESQHQDLQLYHLKKAVDAMNDLIDGRHKKGHGKNLVLLEKAYTHAEEAARIAQSTLGAKLQAYRIWVVTAYMHEVTTKGCKDAKDEAVYVLGRVILKDQQLLDICERYTGPRRAAGGVASESTATLESTSCATSVGEEEGSAIWSGSGSGSGSGSASGSRSWSRSGSGNNRVFAPTDASRVVEFFLDVLSSVTMLPPTDQNAACPGAIELIGAGIRLGIPEPTDPPLDGDMVLGPDVPVAVVLAMGKHCTIRPDIAQMYPSVSTVVVKAWDKGKELRAMDNFFDSMGGPNWTFSKGWTDKGGDLCDRFGVTVEHGHVTKISLAGNNLRGTLEDDLAEFENLRELVLHGNCITGGVPPAVQDLLSRNPNIVVTGLPERTGRRTVEAAVTRLEQLSLSSHDGKEPTVFPRRDRVLSLNIPRHLSDNSGPHSSSVDGPRMFGGASLSRRGSPDLANYGASTTSWVRPVATNSTGITTTKGILRDRHQRSARDATPSRPIRNLRTRVTSRTNSKIPAPSRSASLEPDVPSCPGRTLKLPVLPRFLTGFSVR